VQAQRPQSLLKGITENLVLALANDSTQRPRAHASETLAVEIDESKIEAKARREQLEEMRKNLEQRG